LNISLATLLEITIFSPTNPSIVATILRYQNYQAADYSFNSQLYSYAGFQIKSYSDNDLDFGGGDSQVAISNTQFVRSLLRQYNDLKRSIASIYNVQPSTTVPPVAKTIVISYATTEGGLVLFTGKSATDALRGALVTRNLSARLFPELPRYRVQA
jgi:hypothetical protein